MGRKSVITVEVTSKLPVNMEEDKDIMFKISYTYHGGKRTTPVFIKRDTLINSTFEQFADILKHEIRYISDLGKIRITYRDEDGVDIDLTEERFQWQMRDAMNFSRKLSMNVIEGVSPASPVQSVIPKRFKRDMCEKDLKKIRAKHSHSQSV